MFQKILLFIFLNLTILGVTIVKVGAYPFPPYLNVNNTEFSGKTIDLINALNKIQDKYKFEFVLTSPIRRYKDLGSKFDLIFYEDLNWNWKDKNIESTDTIFKDQEVFITLTEFYKDKNYFTNIKDKKILVIKGFHYAFADYNASEDYLKSNFKVVFSTSPENTLDFLFNKRAELAIITKSFLTEYLNKTPNKKKDIIINDIPDQLYNLAIIKDKNAPISLTELNNIINNLKKSGNLKELFNTDSQ